MSGARIDLLIATSAGYDEIVRAAMALSTDRALVLYGAETFAFRPRPSTILVPHMPAGVIACVPALEEFGIASRLASPSGLPGCFDGAVTELGDFFSFGEFCSKLENSRRVLALTAFEVSRPSDTPSGDSKAGPVQRRGVFIKLHLDTFRVKG